MKKSGSTTKSKRIPIALIALGISAVVLLTMFILCLIPNAGRNYRNPVLVIYQEGGNVPTLSLSNSLRAAGFEYVFLDYGEPLPSGSNNVVVGVGPSAVSVIDRFKDNPDVAGFVLICPTIIEEYVSDLTGIYPACDIAIFEGHDNASQAIDMCDGRILYERLSGDDTLYGTPIKRGGLFASKVYVNNAQNRTLSLSCFNINDPTKIWFSPLFQNELAGYLSVTYVDITSHDASFGRINAWYVFLWLTIMFGIVSILLQLAGLAVSPTGEDKNKAPISKWVFALIGGISIATTIGIIASTSVGSLKTSMPLILVFMPMIFMACLFGINFKWIYNKSVKFHPTRNDSVRAITIGAVIGLFILFASILCTDLRVHAVSDAGLASGILLGALILDSIFATGLIYASRKSSFAGEGAKNCFGNRLIFGMMFIPAIAALIYGFIPGEAGNFYNGLGGILILIVPYIAVKPLIRHTERSLIPGILHGIVYTLVLASIL